MRGHNTVDTARRHLREVDPSALAHARERLAETGIARLGFLLPHRVKRVLAAETLTLLDHHRQWGELLPEGEGLTRQQVDLTGSDVAAHTACLPRLYDCEPLRDSLSVIAAEPVLPCPEPERFHVSRRHHDGALSRWHWDAYAFALVLVVECPPLAEGGFVQTVAHTHPDPYDADVHRILTRNPIRSWELGPGDLYLLRTDTTLHRVHPFAHGRRTSVAMTFAARNDGDARRLLRGSTRAESQTVIA
ncbi:HalD/BesD family halogenase [Nocardia sp. NPDC004582]